MYAIAWRPGVLFHQKLPKIYEFISGIGIFIEPPDVPSEGRDLQHVHQHLFAVVVVRKRAGAHRSGVDRQCDIACRGVVPGGGRQPHDGAVVGLGDERRRIFAAQKIEGPDRIVQDVAAPVTVTSRRRLSTSRRTAPSAKTSASPSTR